jgi:hypothetical protein
MEETEVPEIKEALEELGEHETGWRRHLAITTALVAVAAAIASLRAGTLANAALLEKDEAVLSQSRASNQWAYYQATSIKIHLLEGAPPTSERDEAIRRYEAEKRELGQSAQDLERKVDESNRRSAVLFEKHDQLALSVTVFQIAITLSAMSALLERQSFWVLSVLMALAGLVSFALGVLE